MPEVILYVIPAEKYFEGLLRIIKDELKKGEIIYVTTNKPYKYLVDMLKKKRASSKNIFFIDCISKHVNEKVDENVKDCVFLDGPQSLTAISVAVNESIKNLQGHKVLLLDSLSILLIYNDSATLGKFSNFIINKMRSLDIDIVLLALESDINKDVMKQIQSFADMVKKV